MLRPYDILGNILTEIESSIRDEVSTETLIEKFSISRSHLNRIFIFAFNQSIADYIRSRKLAACFDELLKADLRIIDIAVMYGFGYEQSFIRAFKNEFGVTPGQFRKANKNTKTPVQLPDSITSKPEIMLKKKFGKQEGYNYAIWPEKGKSAMALTGLGRFKCKWNGETKAIFRIGRLFEEKPAYGDLGAIQIDFAANYDPKGGSCLAVYGWTGDPLIEFYIVENGNINFLPDEWRKGTIFVDGSEYVIYEETCLNMPSIIGVNKFKIYWIVRTNRRNSGAISVTEHFKALENLGLPLGSLLEISLAVECWDKSGSAEICRNELTLGLTAGENGQCA